MDFAKFSENLATEALDEFGIGRRDKFRDELLRQHLLLLAVGVCHPVPPCLVKTSGGQIQANVQGPMKQNASPGEAPRRRWKLGSKVTDKDESGRTRRRLKIRHRTHHFDALHQATQDLHGVLLQTCLM